jgi:sugar phosphate isomerase/epimerase
MPVPVALILYTLREQLKADYAGTIRRIAQMGYSAVEYCSVEGASAGTARALCGDSGLAIISAHMPAPVGDDASKILDDFQALGCQWLVCGRWKAAFESPDAVKQSADIFNQAAANARSRNVRLALHNHWWEFQTVPGTNRLAYDILMDTLDSTISFEIDTYWLTVAGQDPVATLARLGERVKLLHIKDGPCEIGKAMTAVGAGKMNFPPIIEAAPSAQWLIVELDSCDGDMLKAAADSYTYLVESGMGKG